MTFETSHDGTNMSRDQAIVQVLAQIVLSLECLEGEINGDWYTKKIIRESREMVNKLEEGLGLP